MGKEDYEVSTTPGQAQWDLKESRFDSHPVFPMFLYCPEPSSRTNFELPPLQILEKPKVCFGSGLERQTLEQDTRGLVSKHARSNLVENNKAVGPGSYEISSQTSAMSRLINKPTSKRGTVLGGRTAKREGPQETMITPAPGAYDIPTTFPKTYKQMSAPFNSWVERGTQRISNIPGVGIYNVAPYKRRTAAFAHSFGGRKCLLPTVKMKCGTFNYDTCERCKKFPEGDYWFLDIAEVDNLSGIKKQKHKKKESDYLFLCRPCYDIEKKENKIFTKAQMRLFKKIRDCSKVHFHGECKAKLFLVCPKEIAKVKERESYMALYFN